MTPDVEAAVAAYRQVVATHQSDPEYPKLVTHMDDLLRELDTFEMNQFSEAIGGSAH